uniref:Sugar phosphate transporter domain-containing protein n=1 Tax=Octactis speculum TaxID=3111310 RepID=A0A7S2HSY6_9STRA|mmetsp:Transcript_9040/g.11547  ORF Transcript_9040/g.11547 Transcript_9040/m.11547 type:complete len:321 (+) Transcript_9040:17-979(+)
MKFEASGPAALGLNFIAAICCIFVNRRLLKPPVSFQLPITLTLVGYAASVVGVKICGQLGMIPRRNRMQKHNRRSVRLAPLIVTSALSPALANYSLLVNSVGVYQLSKVLVTAAIVMLEFNKTGRLLSSERVACLMIVSAGVAVVTVGDVSMSIFGLVVAGMNIWVAGFYKVEWALTCKLHGYQSLELMADVMPKSTVLLFIMALAMEWNQISQYHFTERTLGLLCLCGLTAFLTSWSGYVVISSLSPLTHQILGQAKTCIILLVGHAIFHSELSSVQLSGALVAMGAMVAYTHFSLQDNPLLPRLQVSSALSRSGVFVI